MLISIIAVLFTFGLVIFLHELGHFLVCRLVGIRVEAFSFGFGPELWGRTSGPTRYSIRAVPLGGYVKPAGEELDPAGAEPRAASGDEYFAKPWYARLGVVMAGPAMNYLLAFLLFAGVIVVVGEPVVSSQAVIGELTVGYPAEAAGLRNGDVILSVDGRSVAAWDEMAKVIHGSLGREIKVEYRRGEETLSAALTPRPAPDNPARGAIGIAPGVAYKRVSAWKAVKMGLHQCWYWTEYTVKTLTSNIRKREKPDLAGPIGIVNIVSKAAHSGLTDLVFLIGLISVAVGFFNLLPIPLLDGGWALLFTWEGISRKPVTPEMLKYVNGAGVAVLMSIFLFATYSDIVRIKAGWGAKKAAGAAEAPAVSGSR